MPASLTHDSQTTFAGGEFGPAVQSRIDIAKYKSGLKTARNGFIHPQGGFSNRSGFRFVAMAKYSQYKCRLIPFKFSDTQAYTLEFGRNYIRFYVNDGQIQLAGNPYEIASPYLDTDLPLLRFTQSANTLYVAHPNYAPMTLLRVSDTNWTLSSFPFTNGPFKDANVSDAVGLSISFDIASSTWHVSTSPTTPGFFKSGHAGSLWKLNFVVPAQSVIKAVSAPNQTFGNVATDGPYNISSVGTWTGDFRVDKSVDGVNWVALSQQFVGANNFNVNSNGDAGERCFLRVTVGGLSSGTATITLSAPGFTNHQIYKAASIDAGGASFAVVTLTDLFAVLIAEIATEDWSEGAWSGVEGYPSAVTFYQDRLGWASTPGNPLGLWWSNTGDYVDYGTSDPLVDSDAISVNIPTRTFNGVKHLLPMQVILALTSGGEISIGPGGSGDFTPTSVDLRPQTYHGAADPPPVIVGNQAVFVQARSGIVRSISYQYFTNIFTGEILNLFSNHLFDGYSLLDLCFAEAPYSLIFAVRSDGVLLCFTYMPEQQMMAWTHWDTAGSFESCAVIPKTNYDELWVSVNRSFGRTIEVLAQRLPTKNTQDQFHVDCGIDYNGAPTTSIAGLTYLNGQSVTVLGDGVVYGPFTVVAGAITLPRAVSLAHIGLAYISDVETLNVELPSQDGTSQGRQQRITYLTMRFVDSLGGSIGFDASHLYPVSKLIAATAPPATSLYTGDVEREPMSSDWGTNGRIFFRQTQPLPFTLTGIFPVVESGNL